ncbi:putative N-acetyltransferase YsnE [Agromyces sp. NDB4Y10]|nr:putative N-acetyltransferase YsnE [Agromyces sp. NDB4Y10]
MNPPGSPRAMTERNDPVTRIAYALAVTTPLSISIESPREPGIDRLLAGSTAHAQSLYPPESNFLLEVEELEAPGTTVYVARGIDGVALGMAALVESDELGPARGELKRMFVHDDARGLGVGSALIERIETDAAGRGIHEILLETGPLHHAALALYAKHGYRRIPQFGQYVGERFSVCMSKSLVGFASGPRTGEVPVAVGE